MNNPSLIACAALVLTCGTIALTQHPANARGILPARITPILANAGSTATLTATTNPVLFQSSVSGVIQSSSLGTCVNNAQLEVQFPTAIDQPVVVNGTATWTTIDGASSLKVTVAGTATPAAVNAGFFNAKYQITFTGGTGAYADTTGAGEIEEVIMFTSESTATATWNLKGFLVAPR